MTVGSDVAEITGMLLPPELAEAEGAELGAGAADGVALLILGVGGATATGGGAAATTAGRGLPLNMVNDTIVAPAATAAMSATIATRPLRDLGAGAGRTRRATPSRASRTTASQPPEAPTPAA